MASAYGRGRQASTQALVALLLAFVVAAYGEGYEDNSKQQASRKREIFMQQWEAPKTEGFAVVGYLPEWRFGGTDWCVSRRRMHTHT